jgi:hypothetical protein
MACKGTLGADDSLRRQQLTDYVILEIGNTYLVMRNGKKVTARARLLLPRNFAAL